MKKSVVIYLGLVLASFLWFSCNNSSSAIADLENLVSEIDESKTDISEEELEKLANEYAEVEKNLQKYEYTDEELKEIGRLKGKYAAKMAKVAIKKFKNSMESFGKQIEGGMEGFMEEMENE